MCPSRDFLYGFPPPLRVLIILLPFCDWKSNSLLLLWVSMSDSATRSFWGQDGLRFIRIHVSHECLHVARLQRCHALDGVHGLLSLAQCLEHGGLSRNACRMDDIRGSVQAEGTPSPVFIKRERSFENSPSLEFHRQAKLLPCTCVLR